MRKDYTKEILTDGSVRLTFDESTLSAHQGLLTQWALTAGILLFVVTVTLISVVAFEGSALGWLFLIVSVAVAVFLFTKLVTRKNFIIISTTGLTIGKRQNVGGNHIAYDDIDEIGVTTLSSSAQVYVETAYIYMHAGGRELRLTGHLSKALANTLLKEINKAHAQLTSASLA